MVRYDFEMDRVNASNNRTGGPVVAPQHMLGLLRTDPGACICSVPDRFSVLRAARAVPVLLSLAVHCSKSTPSTAAHAPYLRAFEYSLPVIYGTALLLKERISDLLLICGSHSCGEGLSAFCEDTGGGELWQLR
eukprot:EG_transcript_21775